MARTEASESATMTFGEFSKANQAPCDNCGKPFSIDDLDAKPPSLAGPNRPNEASARLASLCSAADRGINFTRLECADCYGAGYAAGGSY